jgi:uncharacterized repeat protein (TIGR04052 family)
MSRSSLLLPVLALLPFFQGCGAFEKKVTLKFSPQVGEQALRCDASYPGLGKTGSTVQLLDFKLYVRDVTLVRANGERHPLALDQDDMWQRDTIALLDFEDGTGTCDTGSPEVHGEIVGRVPDYNDYTGLEFKLGLPPELNHLDGATAPAPLNAPGMWWSWKGGYKFMRLDVRTRGNEVFFFHLGASGCTGTVAEGFSCTEDNQALVRVDNFDSSRHQLVLDLAALYADVNLDHVIDNETDFISGCMSSATDPECPALFAPLGLSVGEPSQPLPITFFRVK